MPESIHNKLTRVRKPRVHITYEVETEGAVVVQKGPACPGGQVTLSWLQRLLDPP